MNCSTPGLPVHHQLLEFTQTHVHWVSDAIQPSHPLSSPSPLTFNLSQHQCLFKWVSSSHQVAKILEFQLQHQSFQWIFRTGFLEDGLVGSPCPFTQHDWTELSSYLRENTQRVIYMTGFLNSIREMQVKPYICKQLCLHICQVMHIFKIEKSLKSMLNEKFTSI